MGNFIFVAGRAIGDSHWVKVTKPVWYFRQRVTVKDVIDQLFDPLTKRPPAGRQGHPDHGLYTIDYYFLTGLTFHKGYIK
jgi:hypothetical protein